VLAPGSGQRGAVRGSVRTRALVRVPWWARSPAKAALLVTDPLLSATPVDMPVEVLLGKPPRMTRDVADGAEDRRVPLDRRGDHRRVAGSIALSAGDRR